MDFKQNKFSYSEEDIPQIAKLLLAQISSKIWLFYGPMGCGKTTLIKALVMQLLKVDYANSPSFSLVNEYSDKDGIKIYHFDFYRIKNEEEALDIGVEDYFYSNNYCFIEWPDKVKNLLPLNAVAIKISVDADKSRILNYNIK